MIAPKPPAFSLWRHPVKTALSPRVFQAGSPAGIPGSRSRPAHPQMRAQRKRSSPCGLLRFLLDHRSARRNGAWMAGQGCHIHAPFDRILSLVTDRVMKAQTGIRALAPGLLCTRGPPATAQAKDAGCKIHASGLAITAGPCSVSPLRNGRHDGRQRRRARQQRQDPGSVVGIRTLRASASRFRWEHVIQRARLESPDAGATVPMKSAPGDDRPRPRKRALQHDTAGPRSSH